MQIDTIILRIREFLVTKFPRVQKLNNNENLLENDLLDSLAILDVVAFLESEFRITMTDEELIPENFESIQSLANFVEKKQIGQKSQLNT